MYKAFTRTAIEQAGATELGSVNPSQAAIAVRRRIFSPDQIRYYEQTDGDEVVSARVPITAEEVDYRAAAERARSDYADLLAEKYHGAPLQCTPEESAHLKSLGNDKPYSVVVDLADLDVTGW